MDNATRLTHLEVMGDLEVKGMMRASGLDETSYQVTSADASAAAADTPAKTEHDAVVALVNELKTKHNRLVKQLLSGSDT